jgi:ABC-type glycerol-3-phosphate transport system permease component
MKKLKLNVLDKINNSSKGKKFTPFTAVIVAVLCFYSFLLLFLLIWAFFGSFKNYDALMYGEESLIQLFPNSWSFDNYLIAFSEFNVAFTPSDGVAREVYLPQLFLNGFLYAIGSAFCATLVPCLVGYLTAKYNYKFSKVIYTIVIICMIIPIVGNLPAEIQMAKDVGIFDQIWGTWLLKANFLGLYFIVFHNFFKSLPNAYSEAARIDGAGNFTTMLRVILPLATPIFMTVLLLNFITFWNDYQTPLIYLQSHPTVSVGMYSLINDTGSNPLGGLASSVVFKAAAAMLMLIPVLIIFLLSHKKLLGNLTMGGIKG